MKLLGFELFPAKVPEHIEAAEAAVQEADTATADAKAAVDDYWAAADRRINAEYARIEPPERRKTHR